MGVIALNPEGREAMILRLNILQVCSSGKVADACREDILALLRPEAPVVASDTQPEDGGSDEPPF